uniref:Argininosuccinate synthase n=1 Tax=Bionectria ochroleuca TaxID=29856 RepID=A0A8H7NFL2_BIOOC
MSKGRVCLAYSGGLDTSTILKYLCLEGYTVVACAIDVGQEENWDEVKEKALAVGAERMIVRNCQKEFVEEIVWRAVQCNAIYEDRYLLGTSLARPILARELVKVAKEFNCEYLSHGCTGKGNDQVRFELAWHALAPGIKIIAPWRDSAFIAKFQGRADLLEYARVNNIPVSSTPKAPWSMDENIVHCSYEAGILEDPNTAPPKNMWKMTVDPIDAPDKPYHFSIDFEKGIPVKVTTEDGTVATESVELYKLLNKIGHDAGIGRVDIVENRFLGLKSRGCYDSPAATILRLAHIDLEGLTLDSKVRELRDTFVTTAWSRQLYNGMYFSPEREFTEKSIVAAQDGVNGTVKLMAYKGNAYTVGRSSETSNLYSEEDASMDSLDTFSPLDTTGFIAIQAIRLKKYGEAKIASGNSLI